MLTSNALDRGFEPWSGQTKDYKKYIFICLCFCLSSSCDLCVRCYQYLWIVHAWLLLRFYLVFIYQLEGRVPNKPQPGETKQHQWNRFKQYYVTIHQRPVFSGVRVIRSFVLCVCFVVRCLSFCYFSLAIVLSVLPRYMDSDYPLVSSNSSYKRIKYNRMLHATSC